jgi:hypothetical protein
MNLKKRALAAAVGVAGVVSAAPTMSQQTLTGDTKLACEAIICLSSGQRPDQCSESIRRYFSISFRRISDTLQGRTNFLNRCPKGGDAQMDTLVKGIVYSAGASDAVKLNTTLAYWPEDSNAPVISNTLPDYCVAYYAHPYTNLVANLPMYAGDRWVEAADYAMAIAEYNGRMAAAALAATSGSLE